MSKVFTVDQVSQHNTEKDCWITIHGKVYNMTPFLTDHPGGKKVIIKVAGKDASKQFDQFHDASAMEKYGDNLYVGDIAKGKL